MERVLDTRMKGLELCAKLGDVRPHCGFRRDPTEVRHLGMVDIPQDGIARVPSVCLDARDLDA